MIILPSLYKDEREIFNFLCAKIIFFGTSKTVFNRFGYSRCKKFTLVFVYYSSVVFLVKWQMIYFFTIFSYIAFYSWKFFKHFFCTTSIFKCLANFNAVSLNTVVVTNTDFTLYSGCSIAY